MKDLWSSPVTVIPPAWWSLCGQMSGCLLAHSRYHRSHTRLTPSSSSMNTWGSWCFSPVGLKASPATRAAPSSTTFRPSRPEISRLPLGAQTRRGSSSGSWWSEFWTGSLLGESSSVTIGSGFIFVVLPLLLLLLLNSLFSLFRPPSSFSLFHPVFRLFSQHVRAWKELVFLLSRLPALAQAWSRSRALITTHLSQEKRQVSCLLFMLTCFSPVKPLDEPTPEHLNKVSFTAPDDKSLCHTSAEFFSKSQWGYFTLEVFISRALRHCLHTVDTRNWL